MSIDNSNAHNYNHNNRHDKPTNQPPPAKKRKIRKQIFSEYRQFLYIINKLSKEYDLSLFSCIKYTKNEGLECDTYMRDSTLKGSWPAKYVKQFNFLDKILRVFCNGRGLDAME